MFLLLLCKNRLDFYKVIDSVMFFVLPINITTILRESGKLICFKRISIQERNVFCMLNRLSLNLMYVHMFRFDSFILGEENIFYCIYSHHRKDGTRCILLIYMQLLFTSRIGRKNKWNRLLFRTYKIFKMFRHYYM